MQAPPRRGWRATRATWLVFVALVLGACIDPSGRRPGLWLSGDVTEAPADWTFTDSHPEIFLETRTFLGIRQSNTIACAADADVLYVGARDPDTKRWVANVARTPEVRLEIGGSLYEQRLERIDAPAEVQVAYAAYARKYGWPAERPPEAPSMQYYRVMARGASGGGG